MIVAVIWLLLHRSAYASKNLR